MESPDMALIAEEVSNAMHSPAWMVAAAYRSAARIAREAI